MKITRIIKYLGVLYICVSGSYQAPLFWKIEKKEITKVEQRDWERVARASVKKELKMGDVQPSTKEQVLSLVGAILENKTNSTPSKKEKKEKLIRSFPLKRKIYC